MHLSSLKIITNYTSSKKIYLSDNFCPYDFEIVLKNDSIICIVMFPNAGHIGSVDVNILLNHLALKDEGYQNISRILLRNGYRKYEDKYFAFVKTLKIDEVDYDVDVDILSGMYGGSTTAKSQHVQGEKALKSTGGNLAFEISRQNVNIEAKRPDGTNDIASINVIAIVPYFIMKTATVGRGKPKDAYDIYFLIQNYKGGISTLANEFQPYLDKKLYPIC